MLMVLPLALVRALHLFGATLEQPVLEPAALLRPLRQRVRHLQPLFLRPRKERGRGALRPAPSNSRGSVALPIEPARLADGLGPGSVLRVRRDFRRAPRYAPYRASLSRGVGSPAPPLPRVFQR